VKVELNRPEHEHEFEAAVGLPEALPAGEKLLWQGTPDWRVLAREAMHVRLLTWYFAAMLAWRGATVVLDGGAFGAAVVAMAWLLPLVLLALGMLNLLAWLVSRTSVYTITNKRVVMRIGIVLTITFNLPYRSIESAGLRLNKDGTGDIALVLAASDRIAYLHLWPHVRPWQVKRPQPMLRAIPDSARVSALLVDAIAAQEPVVAAAAPRAHPERGAARPGHGASAGPLAA